MSKRKRKNDEYPIDNYLRADENILWTGKPNPTHLLQFMDIFLIPISVVWCTLVYGFAIRAILSLDITAILLVLVFPHFWMAVWLIPGRFLYNYHKRKRTTYAVTNQRLLVVNTLFGESCKSHQIDTLPQFEMSARDDGTGSIEFSGTSKKVKWGRRQLADYTTDFFDIPRVWDVYHLIKNLQAKLQAIAEKEYYEAENRKQYIRR